MNDEVTNPVEPEHDWQALHITDWNEKQMDEVEQILDNSNQLYTDPSNTLKRTDAILSYYDEPPGVSSQALQTNARILEVTLPIEMQYLVPPTDYSDYPGWPPYEPTPPPSGGWPPYEGHAYMVGTRTVGEAMPQIIADLVPHAAAAMTIIVPDDIPEGYILKPSAAHAVADDQSKYVWISRGAPGGSVNGEHAQRWAMSSTIHLTCGVDFQPGETFYVNYKADTGQTFAYLNTYQGEG